ncbi:unnamed protein product [Adineta ricciae]|uniref:Helix-turn-helix domain-containing protein n=1 Tax=Adineta ricciae TaxID=249248 RepID=A0A815GWG6_ADIRI|nr:unnamed protein product [Adineta ricciae]
MFLIGPSPAWPLTILTDQQTVDNFNENLKSRLDLEHIQPPTARLSASFEDQFDTSGNKSIDRQLTLKVIENSNTNSNNHPAIIPTNAQSSQVANKSLNVLSYNSNQRMSRKSNDIANTRLNSELNFAHTDNFSNLHNSLHNKMTLTSFERNPKIIVFTNSMLNSKNKLPIDSDNKNNTNVPTNLDNSSNNNVVATSMSNLNTQPTNLSNKKTFANLKIDSDKKLIPKSLTDDSSTYHLNHFSIKTVKFDKLTNSTESHTLTYSTILDNYTTNNTPDDVAALNDNNKPSTHMFNTTDVNPCLFSLNFTLNKPSTTQTDTSSANTTKLNSFSTTIYRKPTFTGLLTKWNSFVPYSYKVSTLSSMIYRAIRICSSYHLLHEEFEFIEYVSHLNGYPNNFVKSQIHKKTFVDDSLPNRKRVFLDIPFFGKATDVFKKQITKLTKTIDPLVNLQPIQRPSSSLSQYFPLKDPIPKLIKSRVVYELNCLDCDATYIGKTVRHVSKRLHEHGAAIDLNLEFDIIPPNSNTDSLPLRRSDRNKNKVVHYFPKAPDERLTLPHNKSIQSAVKQHELSNNHHIDWTNFNILAKDNKNYQLLVKESLLINNLKPSLNRTMSSVPLIVFPEGLVSSKPKVKIRSTFGSLPLAVV